MLLDHVGRHEAHTTSPSGRRVVQDIVDLEIRISPRDLIDVILQQNVVGVDVGKDQVDLGFVASRATSLDGSDDLKHRSDTRSTCNHPNVLAHVWCVDHGAFWSTEFHRVPFFQSVHMGGDIALRVGLDHEIHITQVLVRGNWSV